MQHSIELKEDGITYVNIIGDGDDVVAKEFVAAASEIMAKNPNKKKFDAIIDMTESGQSTYEGILVYQSFFRDKKLGKLAFVNPSTTVKVFIQMATSTKKEGVEFFKSIDEARDWIVT